MNLSISLDTLPAYLRGEGYPEQADLIEAAGQDAAQVVVELIDAASKLPDGSEAELVCRQMANAIGRANG